MKNASIKVKLVFLCSALILLIGILGGIGIYGGKVAAEILGDVAEVQLPAVRFIGTVDMMHDGLRAVVFRALYSSGDASVELKREIADELKEMSESLRSNLTETEKLDIKPEARRAIVEAKPAILAYVSASEELVGLAMSGQPSAAKSKLGEFQSSFSDLEEKLEVLGDIVEKNAAESRATGKKVSSLVFKINIVVTLIGIIFGIFVSVWIVRSLTKALTGIIDDLRSSTEEVSSTSEKSASMAVELSESTTEQASSLQETMASVEEISAMVTQNAESAIRTKEAADQNQTASASGSRNVEAMLSAIGDIKKTNDEILDEMAASNREFNEIVKIISDIGTKTTVINEIVFQTKLLSFNASVEAARAGEHGKGFSVVAEEVGNLAQMSGNAAKEITDMLADSIKKVNSIVEKTKDRVDQLIEVGKDKIAMGQSIGQKCQESLVEINRNATAVVGMIDEISHASREQSQGISEINKAISQLDTVTQQNSAAASEGSAHAASLKNEVDSLKLLVLKLSDFAGIRKETTEESAASVSILRPRRADGSRNRPILEKKIRGQDAA